MSERVMGLETEWGLTARSRKGTPVCRDDISNGLLRLARKVLPHLRGLGHRGIFLENGSLLYVDCGAHVETATPEVLDPWELVRYQKAGERILEELSRRYAMWTKRLYAELCFTRCNVDYAFSSESAWGCHESHLHRANPSVLAEEIIPHLVTRIVYTGAGGWNSLSPELEFLISPRVPHLAHKKSRESTHSRAIFHTKDEPLAGEGYHRLHLLCGESLCSDTANWLKLGTTALVVAMVEGGLAPGGRVAIEDPLSAMRMVARDPSCKARLRRPGGEPLTALQVQRHYLEQAEKNAHKPFMPSWAGAVCAGWREVLDALERGGPESVADVLEWPLKHALFTRHMNRAGFTWEDLLSWNPMLSNVNLLARKACVEFEYRVADLEDILQAGSPVAAEVREMRSAVRQEGRSWERFLDFLRLRNELYEMDVKFGMLDRERSIFANLDQAGILRHRVAGMGDVEDAMTNPPVRGRARLRGLAVRELAQGAPQDGEAGQCDWQVVYDPNGKRVLDLKDPFDEQVSWKESPEPSGPEDFFGTRMERMRRRSSLRDFLR